MLPAPPKTWAEVPAYVRAALDRPFTKRADGVPVLSHLADVLGWKAGPDTLNQFWGGPRPLVNTIVGAGLGSLGGYAAGRLAEEFLPERYFEPGAARKRGLILGGVLGGLPGAYQSFAGVRETGNLGSVLTPWPDQFKQAAPRDPNDPWVKAAGLFDPQINVNQFNQALFADPNTPMRYRSALAGALVAADQTSDRDGWISPFDVGRIAAGAGVGLASGLIAGKALGLLAGLTPDAQRKVQDVGMWAGLVQAAVPRILGLK